MAKVQPSEIYNLGAQSHVKVSFDMAEYTGDVDALGTLRLLDAVRTCGLQNHVRFYQASTSELYGLVQSVPQDENTGLRKTIVRPTTCTLAMAFSSTTRALVVDAPS